MSPYKSKAQQRYFHYLESKGKMPKKTVDEFDDSSDFEDMPERVQMSLGGRIPDYSQGSQPLLKRKQPLGGEDLSYDMQDGVEDAPHDMEDFPDMGEEEDLELQSGMRIPPHMKQRVQKLAYGGMAGTNYDYEMSNSDEYVSSGEPGTEFHKENKKPMSYYAKGGSVGKKPMHPVMRSKFVSALRKMR